MILKIFTLLGGIAVFLTGLKFISDNFTELIGNKVNRLLGKVSESFFGCAFIGAGATALMQSSVAVNMMAVSLAESKIMTLNGACATIIGTNVGTTVTAQLTSLQNGVNVVTPIGHFLAFSGVIACEVFKGKAKVWGLMLTGFGFVFIGIDVMSTAMKSFYSYDWFKNFFLIKSPPIVLLNGFIITSLCQSSSVVTSILVILAGNEVIAVEQAVYMILGANVGSCTAVIFASKDKNESAREVALFNLVFNLFGTVVFFMIMLFFGDGVTAFLVKISGSKSKAVADFHTLFNIIFGVISFPCMNFLIATVKFIVENERKTKKINQKA